MNPLVSIIMPARDVERYIAHAIRSVLQQSYKNWELVVVENASTDNTAAVIRSFTDHRIKLIYTDEPGLSNARNIGLSAAKGSFICFLDADDALPTNSIRARVELLISDADITFADGAMCQYDEEMKRMRHVWKPSFKGIPYHEMMLLMPRCFCGITWMVRKQENMILKFDTTWTHLEDRLFFLSIAKLGRYDYVNETTYQIRRRKGSLMTKLGALEKAYIRYMKHVNGLRVLSSETQKAERQKFHHMFFRTYLKHFRLIGACKHGFYLLFGNRS